MKDKLRLVLASLKTVKPHWRELFVLIWFCGMYAFAVHQAHGLAGELSASHNSIPLIAVVLCGASFMLRIGSLVMIPVLALTASGSTLWPSIVCTGMAVGACTLVMTGQAYYFAAIAMLCLAMTWKSVAANRVAMHSTGEQPVA
ncbi:hypothetical protein [Duganella vulcania]|uniref:Uncharacterized protein n=1 Tax=Duganella vulcania TaxID=2692166 RepID=A0A845GFT7_9BURK|nr:hypothetical protein [Duganella vulcania]MYM92370.1 hypothetical protein [Duganella vulcania]